MKPTLGRIASITLDVFACLALFGSCLTGSAQAGLPATAPTAVTPSQLPSANPTVPTGRANLQWDGHLLRIDASGETLSQVLNELASRTGVRISGLPPEDRIYGTYGPAPLFDVLSDLVSGLPVNMLFVERTSNKPAELTFTARIGGPTPPNTSPQPAYAQQQPPTPQPSFTAQQPPAVAPNPGISNPAGTNPMGTGVVNQAGTAVTDTNQPADTSGNPSSPNGVKTPQEIFEQLQRLRANAGAPK